MSRTLWFMTQLGLLVALVALPGCPLFPDDPGTAPALQVLPGAVNIDPAIGRGSFTISNGGGRTLTWEVTENETWFTLTARDDLKQTSDTSTLSGTATNETDTIDILVDVAQLSLGLNQGQIHVTSNGGGHILEVNAEVPGDPLLNVDPTAVDFGTSLNRVEFSISNPGAGRLDWTARVEGGASSWLSLVSSSGSVLPGGAPALVALTADRASLEAGEHTDRVLIESNAGSAVVTAAITVQTLSAEPNDISFGSLLAPATNYVNVTNRGPVAATVLATIPTANAAWLSLSGASIVVPAAGSQYLSVTADPAGLTPGTYQAEVLLSAPDEGFSHTVLVSMEVAQFIVSPTTVDLGDLIVAAQSGITLSNVGTEAVAWDAGTPSPAAPWLGLSAQAGTVAGQGSATLTVSVDPELADIGVNSTTFPINFLGGSEDVTVTFNRLRAAELAVTTDEIFFGTVRDTDEQFLGILHVGDVGQIDWSIDTSGFPAWISLQGALSGTLYAAPTDPSATGVMVAVDRSLAPADDGLSLEHTFEVVGTGDWTGSISITVSMNTPRDSDIGLTGESTDDNGIEQINIEIGVDSETFTIDNYEGSSALTYQIDLDSLPAWITSVTPAQDTIDPGDDRTITVNANRSTLSFEGDQRDIIITSNDPDEPVLVLGVSIQVPKVILIRTLPDSIAFGTDATAVTLKVSNFGDPDTLLDFRVTPSETWLSVFPEGGESRGVDEGVDKDWVPITVSIDRAQLDEGGSSAELEVWATIVEDGEIVRDETIEPVVVDVSALASELSFEVAQPRTRIPSLVRYEILMRNKRFSSITLDDTRLKDFAGNFTIKEKDQAIEISETNQFVKSVEGAKTKTDMLIMLDYSGSMYNTALKVQADGQVDAASADPLQDIYEDAIGRLIEELPDHYRIAIGVFNERGGEGIRIITPPADPDAPDFTSDKADLHARLEQHLTVLDHGATPLLPNIIEAAAILEAEDKDLIAFDNAGQKLLFAVTDGRFTTPPGDLTLTSKELYDRRVRLFGVGWGDQVSAGPLIQIARATGGHLYGTQSEDTGLRTPSGEVIRMPQVSELLGWCVTDPLTDIAGELVLDATFSALDVDDSGGLSLQEALDYTPTVSAAEFDSLDADGNGSLDLEEARGKYRHLTEERFDDLDGDNSGGLSLAESQTILEPLTDDVFLDELDLDADGEVTPQELRVATQCDQSVARDLKSQLVLSYITLNEESSLKVAVELGFNDPNDQNSACLAEQGDITGSFEHSQLNYAAIATNPPLLPAVRIGQIGLMDRGTDDDGNRVIAVRAEYIPRNITALGFDITSPRAFTSEVVPAAEGGMLASWNVNQVGTVYNFTSPYGEPLRFGDYGDLMLLRFPAGTPLPFTLDFEVTSPDAPFTPDGKYFTHPDRIEIGSEALTPATAFPRPQLLGTPEIQSPEVLPSIDLGTGTAAAQVNIWNRGGSHAATGLGLYWELVGVSGSMEYYGSNGLPESQQPDATIFGLVTTSKTPDFFTIVPDRAFNLPGDYEGTFFVAYALNGLGLGSSSEIITVYYSVLPPELFVSIGTANLDPDNRDAQVTIRNDGQSTMDWSMNSTLFPFWLSATQDRGSLGPDAEDTFNLRLINIDQLDPGDYTFDIEVTSAAADAQATISVNVTIPTP